MDPLFVLPFGPLVILALRIVDVPLGTIWLIVMERGQRTVAAAVASIEVLIGLVAVGHVL